MASGHERWSEAAASATADAAASGAVLSVLADAEAEAQAAGGAARLDLASAREMVRRANGSLNFEDFGEHPGASESESEGGCLPRRGSVEGLA